MSDSLTKNDEIAAQAASPTPFFYGWVIVGVAAVLGFLGTGFYSYSRGVFLPALAEDLGGGSRFAIAMGFSVAGVTGALMAPWLGRVLDRRSPKRVMLVGILCVSASYLLLSGAESLWHYYLTVGIGMGVGMACMGGQSWHRTVISWFDHWRGRAIAIAVMGASLAGVMMPPLVTALVESVGWRGGFVTFAAITGLTLLPLVYFLMKDRPEDVGEVRDGRRYAAAHVAAYVPDAADARVWHWKEMLHAPALWAIALIFGGMGCVYSAVMLHLFGHLTDIGVSIGDAALVLSATALFSALGKPVVGWMADLFGARVTIWMALVCQGSALFLFASAETFLLSLCAACLYGFGYSGMSPLRTFSVSTALGSASFGAAIGVLRIIELPLVISASPLAGFIYDTTGSYRLAFLILAALMAVACAGPLFIRAGGARERSRQRQR
ncbi:MAG: MFS transporter [Pseudomonadales bacterium]